jgi:hypothetical protein
VMRLSYMLGTEPITMLPSPYLPDKCTSPPACSSHACACTHAATVRTLSLQPFAISSVESRAYPVFMQGRVPGSHQRQRAGRAPAAGRLRGGHPGAAAVRESGRPHQRARGAGRLP